VPTLVQVLTKLLVDSIPSLHRWLLLEIPLQLCWLNGRYVLKRKQRLRMGTLLPRERQQGIVIPICYSVFLLASLPPSAVTSIDEGGIECEKL
jgi:hypothetical protein